MRDREVLARRATFEILFARRSSDATLERLDTRAAGDPRLRVVELDGNFGSRGALGGIQHAREGVVNLDCDGQTDPAVLPRLLGALSPDTWGGSGGATEKGKAMAAAPSLGIANALIVRITASRSTIAVSASRAYRPRARAKSVAARMPASCKRSRRGAAGSPRYRLAFGRAGRAARTTDQPDARGCAILALPFLSRARRARWSSRYNGRPRGRPEPRSVPSVPGDLASTPAAVGGSRRVTAAPLRQARRMASTGCAARSKPAAHGVTHERFVRRERVLEDEQRHFAECDRRHRPGTSHRTFRHRLLAGDTSGCQALGRRDRGRRRIGGRRQQHTQGRRDARNDLGRALAAIAEIAADRSRRARPAAGSWRGLAAEDYGRRAFAAAADVAADGRILRTLAAADARRCLAARNDLGRAAATAGDVATDGRFGRAHTAARAGRRLTAENDRRRALTAVADARQTGVLRALAAADGSRRRLTARNDFRHTAAAIAEIATAGGLPADTCPRTFGEDWPHGSTSAYSRSGRLDHGHPEPQADTPPHVPERIARTHDIRHAGTTARGQGPCTPYRRTLAAALRISRVTADRWRRRRITRERRPFVLRDQRDANRSQGRAVVVDVAVERIGSRGDRDRHERPAQVVAARHLAVAARAVERSGDDCRRHRRTGAPPAGRRNAVRMPRLAFRPRSRHGAFASAYRPRDAQHGPARRPRASRYEWRFGLVSGHRITLSVCPAARTRLHPTRPYPPSETLSFSRKRMTYPTCHGARHVSGRSAFRPVPD